MARVQDDYRIVLRAIGMAVLEAIDPRALVKRTLALRGNTLVAGGETFELAHDSRIYIVGAGKAAFKMARGAIEVLRGRLFRGVVAVPENPAEHLAGVELVQGGHPLPSQGSILAGEKISALLKHTRQQDFVIALISGGGSTLMELPREGLDLQTLQKTNAILLNSGASIEEINNVRTVLSKLKGGGLLKMILPAKCISLILSDVIGNSFEAIASGPTIHPSPPIKNALGVLETYQIKDELPRAVLRILRAVESKSRVQIGHPAAHFLIGSVHTAAKAAASYAQELGFQPFIVTTSLKGESRKAGTLVGALAKSVAGNMDGGKKHVCLILGGETTVKIVGSGCGGRAQELALAFAVEIEGYDHIGLMTLATDGVDGPTPAAGAFANGNTIQKARAKGINPFEALQENDSYTFFRGLGDLLVTGPSGTNVSDLVICIIT